MNQIYKLKDNLLYHENIVFICEKENVINKLLILCVDII